MGVAGDAKMLKQKNKNMKRHVKRLTKPAYRLKKSGSLERGLEKLMISYLEVEKEVKKAIQKAKTATSKSDLQELFTNILFYLPNSNNYRHELENLGPIKEIIDITKETLMDKYGPLVINVSEIYTGSLILNNNSAEQVTNSNDVKEEATSVKDIIRIISEGKAYLDTSVYFSLRKHDGLESFVEYLPPTSINIHISLNYRTKNKEHIAGVVSITLMVGQGF